MNSALTGVRLSPSEVKFERDGIKLGVRRDGRSLLDSRHVQIQVGLLSQANGSCRARTVLTDSDVLCGIKFEVGSVEDESIQCSVDLGAIARADLFGPVEAQKRAERRGLEMADQILSQLANRLTLPSVLIPGRVKWICYVDVIVFADGGNLGDLVSLAVYAALCNCRIPVAATNEDEDDFDVNPDILSAERLSSLEDLVVGVTCWLVAGRVICDPMQEEEACAECAVACSVNKRGEIVSMTKLGSGSVDATLLGGQILAVAAAHAKQLFQFVDREIARQEQALFELQSKPMSTTTAGNKVCLTRLF